MDNQARSLLIGMGIVATILLGVGCSKQSDQDADKTPAKTGTATSTFFTECTAPLEADLNIQVSKKYEFGGVMGGLFTAIECGEDRVEKTYAVSGLNPLKADFVVFIPWNAEQDQVALLEDDGFICEYETNSQGERIYSGECRLKAGKSLSLERVKELHQADLEFSYSFFILNPNPVLRDSFVFESKIPPNDPLCSVSPTPREIGDVEYPTAQPYSMLDRLGQEFTYLQCSGEKGGLFGMGSMLGLKSNPSPELKAILQRAGYICANQLIRHSECTEWLLIPFVPIEYLLPIENHLEEVEGEGCFHCG